MIVKRIFSFLTVALFATVFLVGCSKSDSGDSPTPTPTPTPNNAGITTNFLQGVWRVQEATSNGVNYSTSQDADIQREWNALRGSTFTFSGNSLTLAENFTEDNNFINRTTRWTYTLVEGNKLNLSNTDNNAVRRILSREGENLIWETTTNGVTRKITLTKGNSSAPSTPNTPSTPTQRTATAKVTTTGASLSNVRVLFFDVRPTNGVVSKGVANLNNGVAELNVTDYIGQTLYFIAMIEGQFVSDILEKTITEGDNTILLVLQEVAPTGAKITVTKNGNPVAGETVYLLNRIEALVFQPLTSLMELDYTVNKMVAMNILEEKTKAITDAQGVASFENLSVGDYTFVVLGEDTFKVVTVPVTAQQMKEATIAFIQKVRVLFNIIDVDRNAFTGTKVTIGSETKIATDRAFFELERGREYFYTAETPCGEIKTGTFEANTDGYQLVQYNVSRKGSIILQNNSRNPYTVTISGVGSYVLQGESTRTFGADLGEEYTISWRQNSGYLVYPTTGNTRVTTTCDSKEKIVKFP